jgi:hypothetical protein
VIYLADDSWVIDIGILIFRDEEPPVDVRVGHSVRGEVSIGVDPYFYFERLATRRDAPALIYDWTIEKIEMQTAPLIQIAPKYFARDERLLGWREIDRTDAWNDDGGTAWYRLHCDRVDGPPKHALGAG